MGNCCPQPVASNNTRPPSPGIYIYIYIGIHTQLIVWLYDCIHLLIKTVVFSAYDEPPPPPTPDRAAAAIPPRGEIQTPNLKMFAFAELRSATRNFRPDTVLGEGGFGRVFKGYIDAETLAPSRVGVGMPVAVKKSNPDSEQGLKEWQVCTVHTFFIQLLLLLLFLLLFVVTVGRTPCFSCNILATTKNEENISLNPPDAYSQAPEFGQFQATFMVET